MSSFLHGLGLLLLPLCGWLAGDAVQAQTTLHLAALQGTITLLQRIRQEIQYRRADLQSLYRQLCREGLLPQNPGGTLRGVRTIYSRHAAQHSGRPVCRTVWGWLAV